MAIVSRSDLVNADSAEITDYLIRLGWSAVGTNLIGQELIVEATGVRDLNDDLNAFIPTAVRGEYISPLPDVVSNALGRLKAQASTNNVVRDVLILFRYLNNRIE